MKKIIQDGAKEMSIRNYKWWKKEL